jgi:hypothetical protein
MVFDNACLHKFVDFSSWIGTDTPTEKYSTGKYSVTTALRRHKCPVTTPCSGMPDYDTNGSWWVDSSK